MANISIWINDVPGQNSSVACYISDDPQDVTKMKIADMTPAQQALYYCIESLKKCQRFNELVSNQEELYKKTHPGFTENESTTHH